MRFGRPKIADMEGMEHAYQVDGLFKLVNAKSNINILVLMII